ncbi:MAG TPA: DUF502 domain-containing protein [Verrucomicrobiae bacterium]|nr:DUF502 domain-containing protein [Verrucomicrobiae bacterium]
MTKTVPARWRGDFFAGLAIVLPVVVSLAVLAWLFGTVANITDTLLFFLPHSLTHDGGGTGKIYWYWSLASLAVAVLSIMLVGRLARHYLGKKTIQMLDDLMLRVPLLNKIYGTVKQVNDAFSPSNKSSFKQVVLVQFPCPGQYSMGFVTGDARPLGALPHPRMVNVFVPTTPNPTSGFLILVPEDNVTKLDLSVAEGIKFIISLGAITPDHAAHLASGGAPKP